MEESQVYIGRRLHICSSCGIHSSMRLTAAIRLLPTPEQADALKRTLEAANAACNSISQVAWASKTFRQFAIHRLVYQDVRETFGLAAQLVVRCIGKVVDAYKLDRKTQHTFQRHGAVPYDDRILSYNIKGSEVSISTLDGRQVIPFVGGERQRELLATQRGETDLAFVRGKWYLFVTCDVEAPEPIDVEDALGVDLGIVNLATDSDGESFTGEHVERRRQWYLTRRQALQKISTKSAKRRLRQLRSRQRRFQKDTNHSISKRLVAKAERTKRALVLENLKGIRQRARVKGPKQRARHSNWAFGQLRAFIGYKAQRAGVPVTFVDPAYTSQRCSACGHTERRNRKSQAEFCCVVCQFATSADYNAALNIERAAVNRPMVSAPALRRSG
jgi:IS605 OrfB family transposase